MHFRFRVARRQATCENAEKLVSTWLSFFQELFVKYMDGNVKTPSSSPVPKVRPSRVTCDPGPIGLRDVSSRRRCTRSLGPERTGGLPVLHIRLSLRARSLDALILPPDVLVPLAARHTQVEQPGYPQAFLDVVAKETGDRYRVPEAAQKTAPTLTGTSKQQRAPRMKGI